VAFNRRALIQEVRGIDVEAGAEGAIERFGVRINRLPVVFWQEFAERVLRAARPDLEPAAWHLLYNAAHEGGYHTGWSVRQSAEWDALVRPKVERVPEDVLHAAFAVFTAWGWGKTEIVELVPGERLVVRAYDYYEADGAKERLSERCLAPMITGAATAFMELAYGGPYPQGLGTFFGQQVKGLECGDTYGEFVISRVA
jgi:hypothetical protein